MQYKIYIKLPYNGAIGMDIGLTFSSPLPPIFRMANDIRGKFFYKKLLIHCRGVWVFSLPCDYFNQNSHHRNSPASSFYNTSHHVD